MTVAQETLDKLQSLKEYILELGSLAVGFSGGVDSTFLLYVAHEVLGDQAAAITAQTCFFPERETREAIAFCEERQIRQIICRMDELAIPGVKENPKDRCYLCKKALFGRMIEVAKMQGLVCVAEGSNMDDNGDYRPGLKAVAELGILSPLRKVLLTKQEIRQLSNMLGLPTWEKPSFACLASRFVYGEEITEEKLKMVEQAEQYLMDAGFRQFRVRIHGKMARIEVLPEEIGRFIDEAFRRETDRRLKEFGFTYVTLDLLGFRSGSMNETL